MIPVFIDIEMFSFAHTSFNRVGLIRTLSSGIWLYKTGLILHGSLMVSLI